MKRAVIVLLLLIANAVLVFNKNTPPAPAPVGLLEQWRQPRNAAEAEKAREQQALRDDDPVTNPGVDVAEGLADLDRALIQDPAEYIGGDRL